MVEIKVSVTQLSGSDKQAWLTVENPFSVSPTCNYDFLQSHVTIADAAYIKCTIFYSHDIASQMYQNMSPLGISCNALVKKERKVVFLSV